MSRTFSSYLGMTRVINLQLGMTTTVLVVVGAMGMNMIRMMVLVSAVAMTMLTEMSHSGYALS